MEKIIKVVKVETKHNADGKRTWLLVTDEQGKPHNLFPQVPGYNLIAEGKTLKLTAEKGEKFWEVKKIEDAAPVPTAPVSAPVSQEKVSVKEKVVDKPDPRNRPVALSYSKDLVCHGLIGFEDIYNCAHEMELYLNADYNPIYKPDWYKKPS